MPIVNLRREWWGSIVGVTQPARPGGLPRRARRVAVWAAVWAAVVGLLFVGVTVLTVTLWATDPGYTQTTPVTDLSFLALGALIGAGFASQTVRRAPVAGLAQAVLPAAEGSLGRVGGVAALVWGALFVTVGERERTAPKKSERPPRSGEGERG